MNGKLEVRVEMIDGTDNGCGHTRIRSRYTLIRFIFLKFIFVVRKKGIITIQRHSITLYPSRLLQSCLCCG